VLLQNSPSLETIFLSLSPVMTDNAQELPKKSSVSMTKLGVILIYNSGNFPASGHVEDEVPYPKDAKKKSK
jgi:hypothetical protein